MANRDRSGFDSLLDTFAKSLAKGISRRDALRVLGGLTAAATLPGCAPDDNDISGLNLDARYDKKSPPANLQSDCVRKCKELYPPGELRGRCIELGAKGSGPCYGVGTGPTGPSE